MELIREHWSQSDYNKFIEYLKSLGEESIKDFNGKIIPDTPNALGIRIPVLRKISKEISKGNYKEFLLCKKSDCHEEVIVSGLVMTLAKCDYQQMLEYMKSFVKDIYNWAICDTVSFKGLKKYLNEFLNDVEYFLYSDNPWAVRFGLGCLMQFYLTDEYIDTVLKYTDSINSDFYYVQMMQGWLIATAAAKQRDKTIDFLKNNNLNAVTQNMAIKKMRESYRISKEDKELVKKLKK